MTIRREDIEAGRVEFSDVADGTRLSPVHPGDVLRHDFLEPLGMSVNGLAGALGVSRSRSIKPAEILVGGDGLEPPTSCV